jgi:hypothetical protein
VVWKDEDGKEYNQKTINTSDDYKKKAREMAREIIQHTSYDVEGNDWLVRKVAGSRMFWRTSK